MHLKEFISEQNKAIFRLVSPVSKDYGSLLYLKSLAFGLDSVLNEYRQHLVKQEQKVSNCICICTILPYYTIQFLTYPPNLVFTS